MEKTITYNLRLSDENSNEFYTVLEHFSDRINGELKGRFGKAVAGFAVFLEDRKLEITRSPGEYGIELLNLGMVWTCYFGAAQRTSTALVFLLRALTRLRQRFSILKAILDPMRGRLSGMFFSPHIGKDPKDIEFTQKNFNRLISWLDATGEFGDEVKRFGLWRKFLSTKSADDRQELLTHCAGYFENFQQSAKTVLGPYTRQVRSFLKLKHPAYRNREDEIFCGKGEAEYHLNMVASHIMNRGLKESFLKTEKRAVLLPGCMRRNETNCQAVTTGIDIRCSGCRSSCRINRIRRQGLREGFDLFIVPHSSGFTKWLDHWQSRKKTGVVLFGSS